MLIPRRRFTVMVLAFLGAALLMVGCGSSEEGAASQSSSGAGSSHKGGPVYIGLAAPFEINRDLLREGARLAVEEINNAGGVLDGRQLALVERDDEGSIDRGLEIANEFVARKDIHLLIGHVNSSICLPTAPVYSRNGILMLTPGATSPAVCQQGYELVFRSIPNDNEFARAQAIYAEAEGYERLGLVHSSDAYGRGLANAFERAALRLGLNVPDRRVYEEGATEEQLTKLAEEMIDQNPEAIFVAGLIPEAPFFIKAARAGGYEGPFLSGNSLDADEFLRLAGDAADGTVIASIFHVDNPRPAVAQFNESFKRGYGATPDAWAAQSYDAVYLLVEMMGRADSNNAADIARELRAIDEPWLGVTGPHRFAINGEVEGKPAVMKRVEDGLFAFLGE